MSVIEFTGMPRSGKTSVANLLKESEGVVIYPERFDLIPDELKQDVYQYNLWYAQYCAKRLIETQPQPGVHIFERGVVDRLVHGRANFHLGRFSEEQFREYESLLMPYINSNDLTLIFNISASESQNRAKIIGKNVTAAMDYLESLHIEYDKIKGICHTAVYIPSQGTIEEIKEFVTLALQRFLR